MVKIEIRNPMADTVVTKTALAPRLHDLNNKRIALYWNGKAGGDIALKTLGEQLEKRFPSIKTEMIHASLCGAKEKVEAAKSFDAVIAATSD